MVLKVTLPGRFQMKFTQKEKGMFMMKQGDIHYIGGSEVPDDLYCLTGELLGQNDEFALKYLRWQANIQRGIASGLLRSEKEKEHALVHIQLADMIDEQADEMENYI